MTDTELIAAQARRIAELEKQVEVLKGDQDTIHNILVCIGGPLNDNKLGYTGQQLGPFRRIYHLVKD